MSNNQRFKHKTFFNLLNRFMKSWMDLTQGVLSTEINIWIVGDSYVRRGEERAREMVGPNLGLDAVTVRWFGSGGLRWRSLVPMLEASLRGRTAPGALIIICGSNDLGRVTGVQLVGDMKKDINYLHRRFPAMKIIWSGIAERRRWRSGKPGKLNKARKWVNSVIGSFVSELGGFSVCHPHIKLNSPGASFIKLCVGSLLKVYVRPKAEFCVRQKIFRLIKPCVHTPVSNFCFINHRLPTSVRS